MPKNQQVPPPEDSVAQGSPLLTGDGDANKSSQKRPREHSVSAIPAPSFKDPTPEQVRFSLAHARSKLALLVNRRQLGNPVLRYIRHVRYEVSDGVTADFLCGPTTCVLFLSLQYHLLNPRYIYSRLRSLGRAFRLRILLVLADVPEHRPPLHELTKLGLVHDLTVIVAGSRAEAARYLETFRSYDAKGAEIIQERVAGDYASRLHAALGSVRGISRTDVSTLAFTFGKFRNLGDATQQEIRACPGVGERKVSRLYAALHQPFRSDVPWMGIEGETDSFEENDVAT